MPRPRAREPAPLEPAPSQTPTCAGSRSRGGSRPRTRRGVAGAGTDRCSGRTPPARGPRRGCGRRVSRNASRTPAPMCRAYSSSMPALDRVAGRRSRRAGPRGSRRSFPSSHLSRRTSYAGRYRSGAPWHGATSRGLRIPVASARFIDRLVPPPTKTKGPAAAMETKLNAERRSDAGKGVARKLRAAGKMPAVLYGQGLDTTPLTVDSRELGPPAARQRRIQRARRPHGRRRRTPGDPA